MHDALQEPIALKMRPIGSVGRNYRNLLEKKTFDK